MKGTARLMYVAFAEGDASPQHRSFSRLDAEFLFFFFFFPLSFIVNALLVLAEDALHDGAAEEEEYSRRLHC